MEKREYANGTYLLNTMPWGIYVGGAALCADGKVRRLKRIAQTADTAFSVPASVTVKGKTVSGFVTTETLTGSSVPTMDDPTVVRFHAYTYGKNGGVFNDV